MHSTYLNKPNNRKYLHEIYTYTHTHTHTHTYLCEIYDIFGDNSLHTNEGQRKHFERMIKKIDVEEKIYTVDYFIRFSHIDNVDDETSNSKFNGYVLLCEQTNKRKKIHQITVEPTF